MGKKRFDIYIAGAMGGRTVGAVLSERKEAAMYCREFGLTFYDPAADENLDRCDPGALISTTYTLALMEKYVKKDDKNLDLCRYLVNLTGDSRSDGSSWEMGRAYYRNHTPIILVAPLRAEGQLMQFSNLKAMYIARTIKEAIRQVKILKENNICLTSRRKIVRP